jgi:hypothetical protein
MANQKQSYQCNHDARPGCCIEVNCINWNHLQPTDVEAIFGKRSSSILAARLAVTNYPEYRRLKLIAMQLNLIPNEVIPYLPTLKFPLVGQKRY